MDFTIPTQGLPQRRGRQPPSASVILLKQYQNEKEAGTGRRSCCTLLLPGGRLDLQLLFQEGEEGAGV